MWLSKTYDNKLAGTLLLLGNRLISISEGLESTGEKMGVAPGPTIKVAYLLKESQDSCVTYYPCKALTYLGQTRRGVRV